MLPTTTGSGVSTFVIARSAEGDITAVVAVALLFALLGSLGEPVTEAVLVKVPVAVGVTLIVTVAEAPLLRLPSAHVMAGFKLQVPWLGAIDTNVTLAGSVSETVTPVAIDGPPLVTLMV